MIIDYVIYHIYLKKDNIFQANYQFQLHLLIEIRYKQIQLNPKKK